jgi:hypothetical protein
LCAAPSSTTSKPPSRPSGVTAASTKPRSIMQSRAVLGTLETLDHPRWPRCQREARWRLVGRGGSIG